MPKMRLVLLIAGFLCLAAVPARAGIVDAVGEGWCRDSVSGSDYCNNTDTSAIWNTFAGNGSGDGVYRNWFAIDIPAIGLISNATLWIWNDGQDSTGDASRTYTLYNPAAIDFGSLGTGSPLGTVNVGDADTGLSHYVGIPLNATALSLLNAAQGGQFLFGGAVDIVNPAVQVEIFGWTEGIPLARLEYNAVPEPGTLSMLLAGLAVLGMAIRRKRA